MVILEPPGTYSVKLTVNGRDFIQPLTVIKDPHSGGTEADITAQNTPADKFAQIRTGYAQGMGGLPIVGDPDHVASQLIDLSKAGLTGVALSLVNYIDELALAKRLRQELFNP